MTPRSRTAPGRLELAERLFTDTTALAARVMVNRVWGWHFGKGLVATASDFGTQGDKPTHPELLDDLAARFIEHGWSLKWLNKEIMMSAAYRQSSQPRADGLQADEANVLLWRQNPRRLDAEAYRDTLTRSAGLLDLTMGGLSGDIDEDDYYRRAIYGRVSRARRAQMLGLFDFPEATQSAPGRDITTSTLQQIYLMNGAFMQNLAEAAAKTAASATGEAEQIGVLYRRILARDPTRRRAEERPELSAERHAAALRANPARRPTRRFFFHEDQTVAPGNARGAGWRPWHVWPGWCVCGVVPGGRSRCGPWQLRGPRAAGEGEARHHDLSERRAVADRHVRPQAGAVQVRRPASERGRSADRARRRPG